MVVISLEAFDSWAPSALTGRMSSQSDEVSRYSLLWFDCLLFWKQISGCLRIVHITGIKSIPTSSIIQHSRYPLARSSGIAGKAGIASSDVSVQLCKQLWELKEDRSLVEGVEDVFLLSVLFVADNWQQDIWHIRKRRDRLLSSWSAFYIPSRSLTQPLKSYLPNRKVVFQPPFFRGYVKLGGGPTSEVFFEGLGGICGCWSFEFSLDSFRSIAIRPCATLDLIVFVCWEE